MVATTLCLCWLTTQVYRPATARANQGIGLRDAADHLRPAPARRPLLPLRGLVLSGWQRRRGSSADGCGHLPCAACTHDSRGRAVVLDDVAARLRVCIGTPARKSWGSSGVDVICGSWPARLRPTAATAFPSSSMGRRWRMTVARNRSRARRSNPSRSPRGTATKAWTEAPACRHHSSSPAGSSDSSPSVCRK